MFELFVKGALEEMGRSGLLAGKFDAVDLSVLLDKAPAIGADPAAPVEPLGGGASVGPAVVCSIRQSAQSAPVLPV